MVILRGLPGAGKSHVAKIIKVSVVCMKEKEQARERERGGEGGRERGREGERWGGERERENEYELRITLHHCDVIV